MTYALVLILWVCLHSLGRLGRDIKIHGGIPMALPHFRKTNRACGFGKMTFGCPEPESRSIFLHLLDAGHWTTSQRKKTDDCLDSGQPTGGQWHSTNTILPTKGRLSTGTSAQTDGRADRQHRQKCCGVDCGTLYILYSGWIRTGICILGWGV